MVSSQRLDSESSAWHLVTVKSRLRESHQRYWYDGLGSVLSTLLESAGYSHEAQFDILLHFSLLVTPFLGREPTPEFPRCPSFMTDDHTPVEFSWDFHTGSQQPTVRYSFEPILLEAGTASNPTNFGASSKFKATVMRWFPETNTTWFDHFAKYFATTEDGASVESHSSTTFWAFDLTEHGALAKAYFFPEPLALATKRTNLETVLAAIESAPGYHTKDFPSLKVYWSFENQNPQFSHELDMLALDLESPERSRLKVYFRDRRTSFNSVRENMSLGGRIDSLALEKGLDNLRKLWHMLFGTEGAAEDASLPHNEHRTAGVLYNVELRIHQQHPLVKVYIPVRHYSSNDEQVNKALERYLSDVVGQRQEFPMAAVLAKLYRRCMHQAFDSESLSSSRGVHTYIGCSIQAGGELRLVAYLNPQESKIRRKEMNLDHL